MNFTIASKISTTRYVNISPDDVQHENEKKQKKKKRTHYRA